MVNNTNYDNNLNSIANSLQPTCTNLRSLRKVAFLCLRYFTSSKLEQLREQMSGIIFVVPFISVNHTAPKVYVCYRRQCSDKYTLNFKFRAFNTAHEN